MKQTPARPIRTQSIGEGHDVMSQEPESSFIRGTAERVSQTPRQPLQNEQEFVTYNYNVTPSIL